MPKFFNIIKWKYEEITAETALYFVSSGDKYVLRALEAKEQLNKISSDPVVRAKKFWLVTDNQLITQKQAVFFKDDVLMDGAFSEDKLRGLGFRFTSKINFSVYNLFPSRYEPNLIEGKFQQWQLSYKNDILLYMSLLLMFVLALGVTIYQRELLDPLRYIQYINPNNMALLYESISFAL